ncbi:MAG: thiamine phosphate synthase [Bacteroidetes bacterium 43-16]|nr:MAG: thiamine phosphate synthase [Bacteroidetes bacterium 43-16]
MIIVLTPEQTVSDEHGILRQLFEAGLERFHIRKYWLKDAEMKQYLDAVDPVYRQRLVLHSHYHLAKDYGINRLHFREEDRLENRHTDYQNDYSLSTSVHDIVAFNGLGKEWQYAFLSPMYPSISKQGYGTAHTTLSMLAQKEHAHAQLIGLGGIDASNCSEVLLRGADGIALLGSVWQAEDPVHAFREIQESCATSRAKKQDK